MNALTAFFFKKKAQNIFNNDEKDKHNSIVDAYDSVENKVIDAVDDIKKLVKGKKCKDAGCKLEPIENSQFCKYHKCHKCTNKRAKYTIYCETHSTT